MLGLAGAAEAQVQGHYANVNGLKLYYELHGPTDSQVTPLVLLHGGGSTIATSFDSVLEALAKTRPVIAFEQQGHGRTADIVERPFSFEQSADDTAALLGHLKIRRADFYGYSNGGNIAMQMALRHPAMVRKLIVASAFYKREGMYPQFWEAMQHASLSNMPAELRDAYLKLAPQPEHLQLFHDKCARRVLEFKDWSDADLRSIQAPTLILIGDADIVRPEHAVAMFRLLPHAQLAVLPGTDHMTLVKRADLLLAIIPAFLDAPLPGSK